MQLSTYCRLQVFSATATTWFPLGLLKVRSSYKSINTRWDGCCSKSYMRYIVENCIAFLPTLLASISFRLSVFISSFFVSLPLEFRVGSCVWNLQVYAIKKSCRLLFCYFCFVYHANTSREATNSYFMFRCDYKKGVRVVSNSHFFLMKFLPRQVSQEKKTRRGHV